MPSLAPPDPGNLPGKRLKTFGEKLIAFIESIRPVPGTGTTITESEGGTAVNVDSSGGDSGGGDTETITGAYNGVPATLNVKTDGDPWVEIE